MRSVFSTNAIFPIYLQCIVTVQTLLKSSYYPYCSTNKICTPVCSCEVAPSCILLPMDDYVRKKLLIFHNHIRGIQSSSKPPAAGLSVLSYDNELEEASRCWAVKCSNFYSECFSTPKYTETTQSVTQLVLEEGQTPNVFIWMQAMKDWVDHVGEKSTEIIPQLPNDINGEFLNNYAQLITDQILAVGCAWSSNSSSAVLTLVCTYGPRGPIQGEPIYKTGKPCSLCPSGYSCNKMEPFVNLCKLRGFTDITPQNYTIDMWLPEGHAAVSYPEISNELYPNNHKYNLEDSEDDDEPTQSIEDLYEELYRIPEGKALSEETHDLKNKQDMIPEDYNRGSNEITDLNCILIFGSFHFILSFI